MDDSEILHKLLNSSLGPDIKDEIASWQQAQLAGYSVTEVIGNQQHNWHRLKAVFELPKIDQPGVDPDEAEDLAIAKLKEPLHQFRDKILEDYTNFILQWTPEPIVNKVLDEFDHIPGSKVYVQPQDLVNLIVNPTTEVVETKGLWSEVVRVSLNHELGISPNDSGKLEQILIMPHFG